MPNTLVATEPDFELQSSTGSEMSWPDRLKRGMWPKPLVYWTVVFYMGLFIIRPWELLIPELGEFRFERLSVIAVAAIVFLRRGLFVPFTVQNISMVLLYVAVVLSGRFAWDPTLSAPQVTEFFGFLLIFVLIQKAVGSTYQMLFMIASYLMLTTAYVGKAIWEYAFHGAAMHMMGVYRLAGIELTYGHPNAFGVSMLCSLPFALYFYHIRHQLCATWPPRRRKLFAMTLLAHVGMCVLGIMLTRSRATTVGLILYAGLLISRRRGLTSKIQWGILGSIAIVAVFLLSPTDIQERIRSLWDPTVETRMQMGGANASAAGRLEGLLAGVEIFQRYPVTGVGIGNFADYRAEYIDGVPLNAHNLPGELLGELGLVGTLAFSLFFVAHYLILRRIKRTGAQYEACTGNDLFSSLGIALQDALLLLIFAGISCHTLQQYQWYFYAAFAQVALPYIRQETEYAQLAAESEPTHVHS